MMCDSCGNIPFSKSMFCEHSEQYLFTEDGGKHIVCLVCELKATARFQIKAVGRRDWVDGTWQFSSKRVYRTREEAEAAVPAFRKTITTPEYPGDLRMVLDNEELKISIVELELV